MNNANTLYWKNRNGLTKKEYIKATTARWIVTDDCEYFTAHCSNCNQYADSRSLPKVCPKCKAKMEK